MMTENFTNTRSNLSIKDIEDLIVCSLRYNPAEKINDALIENFISSILQMYHIIPTEAEKKQIKKDVEARVAHMAEHHFDIFFSDEYHPWLSNAKGNIDFYYWRRYRDYLTTKKNPMHIETIRGIDHITDEIIDHLEDPGKKGAWQRRGMVVGQVQAGKTANYIGVLNKAADCGYKVLIVLGGSLNILRNQTQERIDDGFIGFNTVTHKVTGVGEKGLEHKPIAFTTQENDFTGKLANQVCAGIGQFNDPVVFVIKKLPSSLNSLISWLKTNNGEKLKEYPMLLIDDEADYYGVNGNPPEKEATAVNQGIRNLLMLFNRSSYLGYTATPFANIFIDPDEEDDLFPRDFILSMEAPGNYVGPHKVFLEENAEDDIIRIISDNDKDEKGGPIPVQHKKSLEITYLPDSLLEAIRVFVLGKAIRLFKGQTDTCYSALINVSRYTSLHGVIKNLVEDYVDELKNAIDVFASENESDAMKNGVIHSLYDSYYKEFDGRIKDSDNNKLDIPWIEIQHLLKKSAMQIEVLEINSRNVDKLDYTKRNYPNGRTVIVVGGMSLSRGITLEGLMVSYFLRNSLMYDTLMQMGRWFGYRPGYEELCRVYMTAQSKSWYIYIAGVLEDLSDQFRKMKLANMTPKEFGLCVKAHPGALIVTAKNKMRCAKRKYVKIDLEGRIVETTYLSSLQQNIDANLQVAKDLISKLKGSPEQITSPSGGKLWRSMDNLPIKEFIRSFKNPSISPLTDADPLCDYIDLLAKNGKQKWDVCFVSPLKEECGHIDIMNQHINLQKRNIYKDDKFIFVNADKRRLAYAALEAIGLPADCVASAFPDKSGASIVGSIFRKIRKDKDCNPLLLVFILHGEEVNVEVKKEFINGIKKRSRVVHSIGEYVDNIVAYSISFPGEAGSRCPQNTVSYMVNKVYQQLHEDGVVDDDNNIDGGINNELD